MMLSKLGTKFTRQAGILQLMDDLGNALAGEEDMLMLGGGNPAYIPQVQQKLVARMDRMLDLPAHSRRWSATTKAPRVTKSSTPPWPAS
ncbi:MAG: Valine--pyruvate aminotransferase [Anaerolineales bacterium]|nr:Valine--pyruvate aminotransferase [Anaerolineales bacterium]